MVNKTTRRPKAAEPEDGDQVTTVKVYRSEAKALAIIAEAHGCSQPEAARRFLGEAFNGKAREAIEVMRESIGTKRA